MIKNIDTLIYYFIRKWKTKRILQKVFYVQMTNH